MRILADENLDEGFPAAMSGDEAVHVVEMGWKGLKNGALLAKAGEAGFGTFVTADENRPYQQSTRGRGFSLIVLDVHPSTILTQTACAPQIKAVLLIAKPGEVHVAEGPHPKRNQA